MEVRNSPPNLPVVSRDSTTLLEDLCLALRDVALLDAYLPDGAAVIEKVEDVKRIVSELSKRALEVEPRLQALSLQTNRRMEELLADCCGYPARIPYAKGSDGIRERFRCYLCRTRERPDEASLNADFWMCDQCLDCTVAAIEDRKPFPGIFLYRTYNDSGHCRHADSETVLASIWWDDSFAPGRCKQCFVEELQRRRSAEETSEPK